jgi:hypothetical protein
MPGSASSSSTSRRLRLNTPRPPKFIQTRFATAAPQLAPVLLPAPPARCQPLLPDLCFDHQFRIAVLARMRRTRH